MPTETFLNLSEEKKYKIISAAKEEFARVPFEETSIKKIVENAGIARGSFYQYFDSKEDVLEYIMEEHIQGLYEELEKTLLETKGDTFAIFLKLYDYMVGTSTKKEEAEFYKKIFENMKTSQDSFFAMKAKKQKPDIEQYIPKLDKTSLRIKEEKDIYIILRMLYVITRKAIVSTFRYGSKEQARKEYLKELDYIRFGVLKQKD